MSLVGTFLFAKELHNLKVGYPGVDELAQYIQNTLIYAGFGKKKVSKPFADLINPGMTVLLKPNWVLHTNYSGHGMDCQVTHPNFILAMIKEIAKTSPGKIIIGDAPIQSCDFNLVLPLSFQAEAQALVSCPIEIVDFRRTIVQDSTYLMGIKTDRRPKENFILFDLGKESLLEPISQPGGKLRVTKYDPQKLAESHHSGCHQYLLCREAFEADVIFNLPKLKTHKKAGLTGALKNLVGLNGNKDYLPHHRVGGTSLRGDCYPGLAPLKRLAEYCLDQANRQIGRPDSMKWITTEKILLRLHTLLFHESNIDGSWYGNDTIWRMVLDLNRVLLYGKNDGTMSTVQQRTIYSLTDGIIAGQGEGPLAPNPAYLGAITFSESSVFADIVNSALIRLDWNKIPLLRQAFSSFTYPLVSTAPETGVYIINGEEFRLSEIAEKFGLTVDPPTGWKQNIELIGSRS